MKVIFRTLLALALVGLLLGPVKSYGNFIWELLYDPVSARSAGMADAISSLPGDHAAMAFNPAALGFSRQVTAFATYSRHDFLFGAEHRTFAGVIYPTGNLGTFAGNLIYRLTDEWTFLDPYGNVTSRYRYHWIVSRLSYGREVLADLSIGAAAKFIYLTYPHYSDVAQLQTENTSTWALDASVLYKIPLPRTNIGLSLLNVGPDIQFPTGPTRLPLGFRAGMSTTPISTNMNRLVLGFDIDNVFEDPEVVTTHWGAEYTLFDLLSLRIGFLKDLKHEWMHRNGITYGLGIHIADICWIQFANMNNIYSEYSGPYFDTTKFYLTASTTLPFSQKHENRK